MPLFEHGFLGAEADKEREQILQNHVELFALLKDLNNACHEYLRTVKCNYQSFPYFQVITYFMRGLMTFQSLVILLERGCIEDVRALCRTLLQANVRLAAIAVDSKVIYRIIASDVNWER